VPAGTIGRVSASSPARDAERRRAGGTVLDAVLERITYANEETGYSSSFDLVSHAPPGQITHGQLVRPPVPARPG
jgi:hypothetical protein